MWASGGPPWALDATLGVGLMQLDSSDVINFYQDFDGNSVVDMVQTVNQDQVVGGRNGPAMGDPDEGAGIGCHDQDCQSIEDLCGLSESFAGYICEIIIYSKILNETELANIEAYLHEKYFRQRQDPNPEDPDLRLWLSAYDLQDQEMSEGDPVLQWVDKSSYGTIFEPRDGELEEPHYAEVLINSLDIPRPAVSFEADGDHTVPGNRDRLWQVNNKGAANPLNSGPGDDLTVIAVWANNGLDDGATGSYNSIIAMRGTTNSPWILGQGAGGNVDLGLYDVTYDTQTVYSSGGPAWTNELFGVGFMQIDSSDVINFYQDYDGDTEVVLAQTATQDASIISRNGPEILPVGEGATIGTHEQDCCGSGEGFKGYICEILVYSKILSDLEISDHQVYLTAKYFSAEGAYCPEYPLMDFSGNCRVGIEDFVIFSQSWLQCNLEPQSLCSQ